MAYRFASIPTPLRLATFNFSWAIETNLSKLLGTPFGLNLTITDVDTFLDEKVTKKLKYWVNIHLSLSGRAIIVNAVLLSTLWFFINIWGESFQIRSTLRDFLWTGSTHCSRARVWWFNCYAYKKVGGLNLIDPEEALHALIGKWMAKARAPRTSSM